MSTHTVLLADLLLAASLLVAPATAVPSGSASSPGDLPPVTSPPTSRAAPPTDADGPPPEPAPQDSPPPPPPRPVLEEQITVSATRTETPVAESVPAVRVFSAEELEVLAAQTLDEALRQVPGFTLFRRSGSRTANPTTQGASLRGVGGTAASRALVLADGVPLNDPFGGWVAWGRVPAPILERVEVRRGGASELYGSPALTGVVHLLRRPPVEGAVELRGSWGERGTADGAMAVQQRWGSWAAEGAAEAFTTDGYVPVPPRARGAVDAPAALRRGALEGAVHRFTDRGRLFLRASAYDEKRDNGTRLQENDTWIRRLSLGGDWRLPGPEVDLALRAWAGEQELRQTFSAVADDRESERRVRRQRVPAESWGLSFQGSRRLEGPRWGHSLVAGLDARSVEGTSFERVFLPSSRVLETATGGRRETGGLFVQDGVELGPRWSATVAARLDGWRQRDGLEVGADGTRTSLPDRSDRVLSPRLAVAFAATDRVTLSLAAYRSFRAPTLNELYRPFRVGDVVTRANPRLDPERLRGLEAAVVHSGTRWRLRATAFDLELSDAIANVTVETTSSLVIRQRRNLGRTRSRGLEVDGEVALARGWTAGLSYLRTDPVVLENPADRSLEGNRVPQVPEHQATLRLTTRPGQATTAGVQVRWSDEQFEDDRNRIPLDAFTRVDLLLSHRLEGRRLGGLELFLAVENLFDEEAVIGRTPVPTVSEPRLVRLGIRWGR